MDLWLHRIQCWKASHPACTQKTIWADLPAAGLTAQMIGLEASSGTWGRTHLAPTHALSVLREAAFFPGRNVVPSSLTRLFKYRRGNRCWLGGSL